MPQRLLATPGGRRFSASAPLLVILAALLALPVRAAGPPLTAADFALAAPQGFGDRQNSIPWSMQWWRGKLYVGTARSYLCTTFWAFRRSFGPLFPYPPDDPDVECTTDPADLPLQAEIWRWTPTTNTWERVYQSPLELDNPRRPGKKLPYDVAFRGMAVYREPDGTEALYVTGVSPRFLWDGALPPPRILRTTDGVTFTPIPQHPGTFLGDLPNASIRSPIAFNGQLFAVHGTIQGTGVIIAAADPARGDNAWRQVSPPESGFAGAFALEVFNGWLYVGRTDLQNGYSVVKTRATGQPPYQFIPVVQQGGYLPLGQYPSPGVVHMYVFNGALYVGTADSSEIIRINPDDTWELVVGAPRQVPRPDGGAEEKAPLSGLDEGFNNSFNDHIWRFHVDGGQLYVGTYDSSMLYKDDPIYGPLMRHMMGADLYRTSDGWYFTPITTTGFDNLGIPQGGLFNMGIRNFASTPYGLFLATENAYYGLQVLRGGGPATGRRGLPSQVAPPARLEVEVQADQRPVLSWEPVAGAVRYHVQRAATRPILIRRPRTGPWDPWADPSQPPPREGRILDPVGEIPGPFTEIAVTANTVFQDAPLGQGNRFLYIVLAEDRQGRLSTPSNLVLVPTLFPPVTFAKLLAEIDDLEQRGQIAAAAAGAARRQIQLAQTRAQQCQIAPALSLLQSLRQRLRSPAVARPPYSTDLEVLTSKLARRLTVYTKVGALQGAPCTF